MTAVQHLPVHGAVQPREHAEQRALAASGRPHQRHHFLLAHRERHVPQRFEDLAVGESEALRHVLRLEQYGTRRHCAYPKRVRAHSISERQTRRFQPTTRRLMRAIPPASRGKLACAVASLIRLPSPLVMRNPPPAWMYSATIEPFHAPPAAVTHPMTSAGAAAGRYNTRQRSNGGSRDAAAAALRPARIAAPGASPVNRH